MPSRDRFLSVKKLMITSPIKSKRTVSVPCLSKAGKKRLRYLKLSAWRISNLKRDRVRESRQKFMKSVGLFLICLMLAGCGAATSTTSTSTSTSVQADRPPGEFFESEDYFVVVARNGDTTQNLAAKYLGDANKDWMIEDYNGTPTLTPGQAVAIPKRPWNLSGVTSTGYQLVPILTYHDIAPAAKGRMVMGAKGFEEQMRYLKTNGYRVITLKEYVEFISLQRQLPKKSVLITFDDGYRSFLRYGYPVLKELGFSATLFIYTDYVAAGGNAFTWPELKKLSDEGFFIQAHSK